MVLTLRSRVLYLSHNKQRLLPYTTLADWLCITEVESVYSAVRTDCLYKEDYFGDLNYRGGKCLQRGTD
jgi:hypothetical protein